MQNSMVSHASDYCYRCGMYLPKGTYCPCSGGRRMQGDLPEKTQLLWEIEDLVETAFADEVGRGALRDYDWDPESPEDEVCPAILTKDGRRFEVDIEVHVIELTEDVLKAREAVVKQLSDYARKQQDG